MTTTKKMTQKQADLILELAEDLHGDQFPDNPSAPLRTGIVIEVFLPWESAAQSAKRQDPNEARNGFRVFTTASPEGFLMTTIAARGLLHDFTPEEKKDWDEVYERITSYAAAVKEAARLVLQAPPVHYTVRRQISGKVWVRFPKFCGRLDRQRLESFATNHAHVVKRGETINFADLAERIEGRDHATLPATTTGKATLVALLRKYDTLNDDLEYFQRGTE